MIKSHPQLCIHKTKATPSESTLVVRHKACTPATPSPPAAPSDPSAWHAVDTPAAAAAMGACPRSWAAARAAAAASLVTWSKPASCKTHKARPTSRGELDGERQPHLSDGCEPAWARCWCCSSAGVRGAGSRCMPCCNTGSSSCLERAAQLHPIQKRRHTKPSPARPLSHCTAALPRTAPSATLRAGRPSPWAANLGRAPTCKSSLLGSKGAQPTQV